MVMTSVLTSGQRGYPIQGLGSYGRAEEKKPSFMRMMWFTSKQLNAAPGAVDPIYLTEAYLYRDLDHDQDGIEIEVLKSFSFIFPKELEEGKYSEMEFAGMAKPNISNADYDLENESVALIVDNGATTALSNSIFNMSHVQQCSVKINLAGKAMSIKATHSGYKSYYIKDVTRAIHKYTTKAFFVPDLQNDLLGERALVTANYRVILDKDPKVSGIFPVTNGEIDPATGLPFLDSSESLFFVETVPLSETQFKNMSGYSLWHWRLGHCPKQTIRDTIPLAKGIKVLSDRKSVV